MGPKGKKEKKPKGKKGKKPKGKKGKKPKGNKGKKPKGKKPKNIVTFILRRLTGRTFKVANFKFVIHHGRIFFGKRPIRLRVSKNKKFPGYFTFTINKWVYYIKFTTRGLIVFGVNGRKVVKTAVITKKKIVIKE